jgi:hypothetical protein
MCTSSAVSGGAIGACPSQGGRGAVSTLQVRSNAEDEHGVHSWILSRGRTCCELEFSSPSGRCTGSLHFSRVVMHVGTDNCCAKAMGRFNTRFLGSSVVVW